MSQIGEAADRLFMELATWALGWLFCVIALEGAFALGRWVATNSGSGINPDAAGVLSSLSIIWIYEHRHFESKLEDIRANLQR